MAALGRPGSGGGSERQLPARWLNVLLRCQLRRGRSRCRNRQVPHRRFPGFGRCRDGDSSARARRAGARPLDAGHWPRASGRNGSSIRITGRCLSKRFHQSKPPTILDVPVNMQWDSAGYSGPGNAGGRSRYRRAAGRRRMRVDLERSLGCAGRRDFPARAGQCRHDSDFARSGPADAASADGAHLMENEGEAMAVIRDVMPAFDLLQPTSVADAQNLLAAAWRGCLGAWPVGSTASTGSKTASRSRRWWSI